MENMKHYFYVPSYNVLRQYLYFKQKFQDVIIVSGNRDLVKFAQYMKWEAIDCSMGLRSEKNKSINIFKRLIDFWKRSDDAVDYVISNIDNGIFYFSFLLIDLWGLKLVKKIAQKKNVKIVYLEDTKVISNHKALKKVSISYRYVQYYSMLLYLLPVKWFDTGGGHYLGVSKDFLKKYGIICDKSPDPFYSPVEVLAIPLKASIEVLIIGGESIDDNKNVMNTENIKSVLRFIKEIRPDACFKYHPGAPVHNELCDSFSQVDSFIPVEFLHKSIKIAVADFSVSLINLSLLGVKCVAYLKLLETYSNFDKDFYIKMLTEDSKGKINFVNSFDELAAQLKA